MEKETKNKVDWEGIVEVILKILTIGLYHVKKHRNNERTEGAQ